MITGAVLWTTAVLTHATWSDLGLPLSAGTAAKDVTVGLLACFAALPPVYFVLALVSRALGEQTHNPLIEALEQNATPGMFLLSIALAVVIAPVCEELTFRLLLQGWLEKWEDALRQIDGNSELAPATTEVAKEPEATDDEHPQPHGEHRRPSAMAAGNSAPVPGFWAELPRGWLAIGVSSAMFAAAHLGQGVAPFALFFLAIALGYVYQRTHRILPSIVAHATFNMLNLIVLWLAVRGGAH